MSRCPKAPSSEERSLPGTDYPDGPRLKELLLAERQLYGQLREMTLHQQSCVERGDQNGLLSAVGEKQGVIDQLGQLEEELKGVKSDWQAARKTFEPVLLAELEEIIGQIGESIKGLLELEDECRRHLEDRRQEMLDRMKTVRNGKAAAKGYSPGSAGGSRFFDRKT